jgi:Ca2+-dependent lipid-binding protein
VSGTTKGEVIDPYVVLEMHGVDPDCKQYKTAVVKNNGFNPSWNEVCLLLLVFIVVELPL